MSKLSFRARALDASKPMPIYLADELPDLPDYSAINRAVPQMPSGMEKEEESEHHLQRAISGTGLIIPTPEVCQVSDIEFYERCYPPDYKMPKQHIHMQPLWEEQETPEYDIDSEDERWLKQQRHPELTELKFEQMMDKLEKSSGQTVVTLNEAKILLERHDDLIIAVYDYWLNKRLTTQHPLILSVKTENRPGQSSNNPYLAFRRRTEKMQTRKNRKNDESSYEKMLKLRRDLARALSLLELVARRESAKRDLVKLTALLAERRYAAGDFANQLLPDPPPRPAYTVPLTTSRICRDTYTNMLPHYAPRPAAQPLDTPRQREKRPYKRRKHRHAPAPPTPALRDSGVYTSSEEESPRVEPASPPDDGPFAFRRKPGCYYEMPTSTLCGDPVDPDSPSKEDMYQHEIDPRHRFTLTSIRHPYPHYIGFARRRMTRGGRLALDRIATPLDDLWPRLPLQTDKDQVDEVELEKNRYRTPKEITRDYHTSGKYPWRHAFRKHLSKNPDLWVDTEADLKIPKLEDVKVKIEANDLPDVIQDSVKSDISVRTMDSGPSSSGKRKRSWSDCSDSSYDSDESLQPVEKEFEKLIDEVNREWLHFRPKTPPPSPPADTTDQFPLSLDTPISIELLGSDQPSQSLPTFTTEEFTLGQLYPEMQEADNSGASLDVSDDLGDNFTGLTEDQVESILSETDLKSLSEDDKKMSISADILEQLVSTVDGKDPFLLAGQSLDGRTDSGLYRKKTEAFGSTRVRVRPSPREVIHIQQPTPAPAPTPAPTAPTVAPTAAPTPVPAPTVQAHSRVTAQPKPTVQPKPDLTLLKIKPAAPLPPPPAPAPAPAPVPTSNIIVEEVNELTHYDHKKKEDTIEEVQLSQGVHLKTVSTRQSPLKKHIISMGARVSAPPPAQPQIVTVAVSDQLKVRLQNHLLSTQSGVLVQNGPFSPVVAVPVHSRETVVSGVSTASVHRRSAPLVALSSARALHTHPTPLVVTQPHIHTNKLKVLHAHPLTHTQRTQLLQTRSQIPTVVSLATLDAKNSNMLKTPGSVAQLFEIKSGQLGKGAHLVNVVRQPQPGKVTRLDLNDKKRQVVFDGTLKGNIATATRPHRVQVSLDGRQIVRAALPAVRAPVRHQIQLKNRPVQVTRSLTEPSTSITIPQTKQIPTSVVTNLLHKNIQLPKSGQKIAISGPGGQALSANVQAITFSAAHMKARQARLIAQPRPPPVAEIVEASTAPVPTTSQQDAPLEGNSETDSNGTVRRRTNDTLPMEVT